jgi:hypothetical protein
MAALSYNPLLNIGDPVQAALLAQAEGNAVQSPFAAQMTPTGLIPMPDIPAQPTTVASAEVPDIVEPTAPVVARTIASLTPMSGGEPQTAPTAGIPASAYVTGFPTDSMPGFFNEFEAPIGLASPQEIADAYAEGVLGRRAEAYKVGNVFEQPISTTLSQMFANPNTVAGNILGMGLGLGGGLLGSALMNAVDRTVTGKIANDYAMYSQGVPGYSVGKIGDTPYSISPGLFGYGQVLTGNVPIGMTISDIERMGQMARGVNPYGDGGFVGGSMFGSGIGGYTENGMFVGPDGTMSAFGTMSNAQALADEHGLSLNEALDALDAARRGDMGLSDALLGGNLYSAYTLGLDDTDFADAIGQASAAATTAAELDQADADDGASGGGSTTGDDDGDDSWAGAYDSGADGYL